MLGTPASAPSLSFRFFQGVARVGRGGIRLTSSSRSGNADRPTLQATSSSRTRVGEAYQRRQLSIAVDSMRSVP